MTTQTYFQDFEQTDGLTDFLKKRIQTVVDQFITSGRYGLITRIHTVRARNDRRKPKFLCEIRLDTPQYSAPIVIKKKSSNFYHAALQVGQVLKKVLRRQSGRRAHHHRRDAHCL
jgi:ribosome-associated translation inhibitor RaiA